MVILCHPSTILASAHPIFGALRKNSVLLTRYGGPAVFRLVAHELRSHRPTGLVWTIFVRPPRFAGGPVRLCSRTCGPSNPVLLCNPCRPRLPHRSSLQTCIAIEFTARGNQSLIRGSTMPADTLHRLAYLATADHAQADAHVQRVLSSQPAAKSAELVASLMRQLQSELHRRRKKSFSELDNILRSDFTTSDRLTTGPRHELLWELKRTCLARTLGCVNPSPRLAFIYCDVYGATIEDAAQVFEIRADAIRLRLTRARQVLSGYLESRCVHFDPDNVCTCTGRLGIALRKGFISARPAHPAPAGSHRGQVARTPAELYARLPIVQPDVVGTTP